MAFIFPTSHLPESGRPYDDDEEEDNTMQPMPRAGGVRAFSHLPVRDNPAPSTRTTSIPARVETTLNAIFRSV